MFYSSSLLRRATMVIASGTLVASSAGAATQGTLGANSTGTVSITASVAARAQITGLTDVTFRAVDPTVAASNAQSDCVWTNTLNRGYSITATGSGTASAFTLASSSSLTVPYTVQWAASTGQTSGTALTTGTAATGMTSLAANPTCSTAPSTTSSLVIGISSANLLTMTAATSYTGTLTLLITPQ